jgi:hypothetical protein
MSRPYYPNDSFVDDGVDELVDSDDYYKDAVEDRWPAPPVSRLNPFRNFGQEEFDDRHETIARSFDARYEDEDDEDYSVRR